MGSEVFRFVTIRPPQQVDGEPSDNVIDLGVSESNFFDALRRARASGSRGAMVSLSENYVSSASFINASSKLGGPLVDFINAVQQTTEQDFWNAVTQEFNGIFGTSPSNFVQSNSYTNAYAHTAESIVAAAIDNSVSPGVRSLLVRIARTLWLIHRLAEKSALSRTAFTSAPLKLPEGIFPLPTADVNLKAEEAAQINATADALAARQEHLAQLVADLSSYLLAAKELLKLFALSPAPPIVMSTSPRKEIARTTGPTGFLLSDATAKSLSQATKAVLHDVGIPATQIDIVKSVALLNEKAASIASQLYTYDGSSGMMVKVGNRIIPKGALAGTLPVVIDPGPNDTRTVGPCPPAIEITPPNGSATVPTGHGDARILGIADLLVLEEELLRYQFGEIAHIENVLKSEMRARRFKTTDSIQQTDMTETETTQEKEQDLSSTERFELQIESQTIINESASKDAGLTIHASYGPSVDATANYNASSSTSTQQSNTAATSYAREVTNKAIDRVQTRTLTRRTVTISHVIEEVNKHSFDNTKGTANIVGIYRYVDKIYRAQVVNYGKRLMLEFIVPEPAAFTRYALTNKPVDNVPQVKPDPPGYCLADGKTFVPLQPTDIDKDHYLYWASKYGAQDVTPPPPDTLFATGSKNSPDQMPTIPISGEQQKISSDIFDVTIPDGYLCQNAFVNIYGVSQSGPPVATIAYQLQYQEFYYNQAGDDNGLIPLLPSPTLSVTINSICFHNYEFLVTVLCTLTPEKYQAWQLKTFASIMNAYNALQSAYDEAIREAKLQASDPTIYPPNPENNAIIVQTELKKGCISLLTGQRFELFDAVARNVAPYGYPEIDFAEAKAEGEYISFFEQAFEWNNMVYLFYPYFWGKKDEWVTIAQLTDNDPLFGQFLRAGAARVQVPVRVGFNEAIMTYLSPGVLWTGEGALITSEDGASDGLSISIIDELKSQTGNNNVEGVGTLKVTKNSTAVTGNGTMFTADDENKRIIIAGVTYVIKTVQDEKTITLTTTYTGNSDTGLGYAIGGKLVGQPWEVKLPTDLVKLDDSLVIH